MSRADRRRMRRAVNDWLAELDQRNPGLLDRKDREVRQAEQQRRDAHGQ